MSEIVSLLVQQHDAGVQLATFLRRRGVSLTMVRSLKQCEDGLMVNGVKARTNLRLQAGDIVGLQSEKAHGFSANPQQLPLEIVYESRDALVIDKPAGIAMHPGPGIYSGTLANAVCGLYKMRSGAGVFRPIGRLDTDTSGLVLCAQNAVGANKLSASMKKKYIAIVSGFMPLGKGCVDVPLCQQLGSSVRQNADASGRQSKTEYEVILSGDMASLLVVKPLTGRTHQIRAHMAYIGHALIGDRLYGGAPVIPRHALHCVGLRFEELGGNKIGLHSALPSDMQAAVHMFWEDTKVSATKQLLA